MTKTEYLAILDLIKSFPLLRSQLITYGRYSGELEKIYQKSFHLDCVDEFIEDSGLTFTDLSGVFALYFGILFCTH